ncbi:hypothetical protein GX408_10600 [bacterium]|nr:hypothetical protein [bacterium]
MRRMLIFLALGSGAEISAVNKPPEFGTTIRAIDFISGAHLNRLVWIDGVFHLQEE